MNIISWEQTQNIANNMLKATDNPDELLMLYLFKLHSLLLDTPVELHHHFAQSLINTGMFNDPVLKNLYGEFFNDEVSDLKQYEVLTHNMPQMLEAHGGHRRSKLNKIKNKSAGNPKEGESKALVPAQQSMTGQSGALVEANSSALSAQDQSHRIQFHEWDISTGVQALKFGDRFPFQIVNNPMIKNLIEEIKRVEKKCTEDNIELLRQRDKRLSELDSQIQKRRQDIIKKFRSEVNKLYMQIGVDILFWLLGALIVSGLKSTPAWYYPGQAVDWVASHTIGEQIMWTTEYIFIAGVIGGIIKASFENAAGISDYSLSVSDIFAADSNKGKALAALRFHPMLHMGKLLVERFKLPSEEDIFQIPDFIKYVEAIEKQKQQVRDHFERLILQLEDACYHIIKELKDELIKLGKDTTNIEVKQSLIEDQQRRNEQPLIEGRNQLLITDEKKTNGGMKKQSKKYL